MNRGPAPSVLVVTNRFPTMASFIENEVRRLHDRGLRVAVVTLRSRSTSYQPDHEPLVALTRSAANPLSPRAWADLAGWLARRPHVLLAGAARLAWSARGSAYALAGHAGYLPAAARVAAIAEREGFDRIHGAWAHFPASVAWLASRLAGKRFSMAGHAGSDLYRTQAFLREKVRDADFVTTCVQGNADMLRALAGPQARIEHIYHGVDLRRFDGAARARSSEPVFLCVGRLFGTKGFDVAVRALAELARRGRPGRLRLVGRGPDEAMLRRLAREGGVEDRVEFLGNLPQAELVPLYRSAWALVAPSRVLANGWRDGIPNVVVEALAMGLPCIGTHTAGLGEAVRERVNGRLLAADDVGGLADALAEVVDDPAVLDAWSDAARASVLDAFDAERNFERVAALFERAWRDEADATR